MWINAKGNNRIWAWDRGEWCLGLGPRWVMPGPRLTAYLGCVSKKFKMSCYLNRFLVVGCFDNGRLHDVHLPTAGCNRTTDCLFKVIGLTQPGFDPMRFGLLDLPTREMDSLLNRPSRLQSRSLPALAQTNWAPGCCSCQLPPSSLQACWLLVWSRNPSKYGLFFKTGYNIFDFQVMMLTINCLFYW